MLAALLLVACSSAPGTGTGAPPTSSAGAPAATSTAPGAGSPSPAASPGASAAASVVDIATYDACALVSPEEVGAIIGDAVGDGVQRGSERTAGCQWDAADTSLLKFVQVYVQSFEQDVYQLCLDSDSSEEVAGIGDAACRREADIHPPGNLVVVSGELMFELVVYEDPPDEATVYDQQTELANLLVSRLPSG